MINFWGEFMKRKTKISPAQIIVIGFLAIVLIGALLLCLPFASRGEPVHFVDALFTATSATCVTGLVSFSNDSCHSWPP